MGYIEYGEGDNELNSYLREHGLSRAGGLNNLTDMISHVRALAPLWWAHNQATLGAVRINSGFMGSRLSDLIDNATLFTDCAVAGLERLHARLATDSKRRDAYGKDHVEALILGFDFHEHLIEQASPACRFIDGSVRPVAATTKVAMLVIDRTPVWSHPDHFGMRGYYDTQSRISTIGYIDQADAMTSGWAHTVSAN
jgi:hypothetical protein